MLEVLSDAEEAYAFIATQVPVARAAFDKGIVQRLNGKTNAAVLYTSFNGVNVIATIAGTPGTPWLSKKFLYWIFHYPFAQMGAKRITVAIDRDNQASICFALRCGFTQEGTLHGAGAEGQDVLLFVLWKQDCRFGGLTGV